MLVKASTFVPCEDFMIGMKIKTHAVLWHALSIRVMHLDMRGASFNTLLDHLFAG